MGSGFEMLTTWKYDMDPIKMISLEGTFPTWGAMFHSRSTLVARGVGLTDPTLCFTCGWTHSKTSSHMKYCKINRLNPASSN